MRLKDKVAIVTGGAGGVGNEVESITVWTYDPASRLSWNNPANGYAAKHSIPYNGAVRLVKGSL